MGIEFDPTIGGAAHEASFAGTHHARYIEEDVPLHVISRVFQGRHLLRPSPVLNSIIIGVLGRGLEVYPAVVLYAAVFLSNHMHAQLQGPADQVALFMGYIKGEICRRWLGRPEVPWSEHLWSAGYVATALPTADSQINCLRYLLSQGVKEGLVAKATLWPGVHSAGPLLRDGRMRGEWFDSTGWTRERDAQSRKKHPAAVNRNDYFQSYGVQLAPIAPWAGLSVAERRAEVRRMLDGIEEEGRRSRAGSKPVGAKRIMQTRFDRRAQLPRQPWWESRRRMICWADPRDEATQEYLSRYREFQRAFRIASHAMRGGAMDVEFPAGAFRPMAFHRATAPPG